MRLLVWLLVSPLLAFMAYVIFMITSALVLLGAYILYTVAGWIRSVLGWILRIDG